MNENAEKRFTEVTAAYTLNRVGNYVNRKKYKEHIIILSDLLKSIDENYESVFVELFNNSFNEQILGASKKEIFAAMKIRYEKPSRIAKKLGLSYYRYNNTYRDLFSRDFITDEWLATLQPLCDEATYSVCKIINNFTDGFKYLAGEPYYPNYELYRCVELEFYIIYMTLMKILGSEAVVEKFLNKICFDLDIDWGTISHLLKNVHLITRNDGFSLNGGKQLKQEIFNLMYLKGFNKGDVGECIFNKERSAYYSGGYDYVTKDITDDAFEFSLTLSATLDWTHLNKDEVLKLIDVFREFSNEGL